MTKISPLLLWVRPCGVMGNPISEPTLLNEKICFSGDVVFKNSIGRTDLPGGNHETLIDSIKNKLFLLEDSVTIYPGHGPITNIKDEKIYNPFLN